MWAQQPAQQRATASKGKSATTTHPRRGWLLRLPGPSVEPVERVNPDLVVRVVRGLRRQRKDDVVPLEGGETVGVPEPAFLVRSVALTQPSELCPHVVLADADKLAERLDRRAVGPTA